jgi:predicted O-methyltransferase YrrM
MKSQPVSVHIDIRRNAGETAVCGKDNRGRLRCPLAVSVVMLVLLTACQRDTKASELDMHVDSFLKQHRGSWHDMNVPEADGRLLHDLIVEHGFSRALEIGTSTGHSTIWIAWALSKTGGRLTTLEIDEQRYRQARNNIEAAGLSDYVDFVLGDAHELVPGLTGPFDFVFSDADKSWYKKYFEDIYPKLTDNACFTAHNVSSRWMGGIREFLDYAYSLRDMETTIDKGSSAGVSITCKK